MKYVGYKLYFNKKLEFFLLLTNISTFKVIKIYLLYIRTIITNITNINIF